MTPLREAEERVAFWTRAHDQAEIAWLESRGTRPAERERLFRVYMLAAAKLQEALLERDKLKVQLGVHPYLRLVGA